MAIQDTIKKFIDKKDQDYYLSLLNTELVASKLPLEKKLEVISKTLQVTEDFKKELIKKYGKKLPTVYADLLNVSVNYISEPDSYTYNYIGQFSERNKAISINMYVYNQILDYCKDTGLDKLVDVNLLPQVVTAHELFHFLQLSHPNTYLDEKNFETKIFGLFKVKTKLVVLEEIAAVNFSKIMTDLPYNPLVFNKIYSYARKNNKKEK